MKNLPIFLAIANKPVLVVGGGDVALRKIQTLLKAKALVTVVSPTFCDELKNITDSHLTLVAQAYGSHQLEAFWLVIAATDRDEVNHQVYRDAVSANVLVNVVDDPEHCQFIFPSIVDRSPLVVAISTGGAAPVLGRLWREQLEKQIPMWTGKLASIAQSYREKVKSTFKEMKLRRYVWEQVFRGRAAHHAANNDWEGVNDAIESAIAGQQAPEQSQLSYISIGSDDPEHLTIKALQHMQMADIVIYQDDIAEKVVELCRKDADYFRFRSELQLNDSELVQCIETNMAQGLFICRLTRSPLSPTIDSLERNKILNKFPHQLVPGVTLG